ncbi:hypothetical protein GCM10018966_025600 [Streptomyces yanii]
MEQHNVGVVGCVGTGGVDAGGPVPSVIQTMTLMTVSLPMRVSEVHSATTDSPRAAGTVNNREPGELADSGPHCVFVHMRRHSSVAREPA